LRERRALRQTASAMAQAFDAVVLLAHGARDARWMEPFYRMRDALAARVVPATVHVAFMEFTAPTFEDAVQAIRKAKGARVLVVPVFLSGGGHVAQDIPKVVGPQAAKHPDMHFVTSGAIGEEPEVAEGMALAVVRLARG
jgi:sirohydrochlorin cobaltochelatase